MRINIIQSGNWSDPAIWYGGLLPEKDCDVYANGNVITIDQDIEVKSITNLPTYPDITGGNFIVKDNNIKINANLSSGSEPLINFFGEKLEILGEICGSLNTGEISTVINNGTGIISVSGNIYGGSTGFSYGIVNKSTGTINVNGKICSGTGGFSAAINNLNNGLIIINGETFNYNGNYGYRPCGEI